MNFYEMMADLYNKVKTAFLALPGNAEKDMGNHHEVNGVAIYSGANGQGNMTGKKENGEYFSIKHHGIGITITSYGYTVEVCECGNVDPMDAINWGRWSGAAELLIEGEKKSSDYKVMDFIKADGVDRIIVKEVVKPVENSTHKAKAEILDSIIDRIAIREVSK